MGKAQKVEMVDLQTSYDGLIVVEPDKPVIDDEEDSPDKKRGDSLDGLMLRIKMIALFEAQDKKTIELVDELLKLSEDPARADRKQRLMVILLPIFAVLAVESCSILTWAFQILLIGYAPELTFFILFSLCGTGFFGTGFFILLEELEDNWRHSYPWKMSEIKAILEKLEVPSGSYSKSMILSILDEERTRRIGGTYHRD